MINKIRNPRIIYDAYIFTVWSKINTSVEIESHTYGKV